MVAVRRVYVYLVSAVGLGLLVTGLIGLLRVATDALGFVPAWASGAGGSGLREQLSLALALTAVGLPLWAAHTWYAERIADRSDASGAGERDSTARALYLGGGIAVLLFIFATSIGGLVRDLVLELVPPPTTEPVYGGPDIADGVATALVTLAALLVLARARLGDLAFGPVTGPAAGIARFQLYGAVLGGLLALVTGILGLVSLGIDVAIGPAPVGTPGWWRGSLAQDLGNIVAAGAVWLAHVTMAGRLAARDDAVGAEERRSRLRAAEPVAFLLVAATLSLLAFGQSLGSLLAGLAGADTPDLPRAVLQPLLGGVVWLALVVRRRADARIEALAVGGPGRLHPVVRLTDLALAAVGLAFVATGTARSLGILIDALAGATPAIVGEGWVVQLTGSAALALVGIPLWVWGWRPELVRAHAEPLDAARSSIRRGYLFLASGVALVATAVGGAAVLYQGFRSLMGLADAAFLDQASDALGSLVAGGVVLVAHALLIRSDNALRAGGTEAPASETAPVPLEPALVARFVVRGPAGVPTDGLGERLRESLPAGWSVEAAEPAERR